MKKIYFCMVPVIIFLAACSSAPNLTLHDPAEQLGRDGLQTAINRVNNEREKNKDSIYNARNTISFLMDRGILAFYAGDYASSNRDLQEAQRLIEEAFTKDIGDNFASFVQKNPYKKEYSGEDFENIYVNVFCALNYYQLGDLEKAQVEIRQVNEKLVWIRDTYEAQNAMLVEKIKDFVYGGRTFYSHSALARYLGMLFWRGWGNSDSARIDAQEVAVAFEESPDIYYNSLPAELVMRDGVCEELAIPAGQARLNLLSFTGLSPVKIPLNPREGYWRYYWATGSEGISSNPFDSYAPAFPALAFRNSSVDRVEVVFDNGRRINLSLLEDMGSVIQQVHDSRVRQVENMTALLRTGILGATGDLAATADVFNTPSYDDEKERALALAMTTIARENKSVDLRMSNYLPGRAYAGGINLAPGTYSFTINYYSGNTRIESRSYENVRAEAGKLNLITDYNLNFSLGMPPQSLPAELPDFPGRLPAPANLRRINNRTLTFDGVPGAVRYYVYQRSPLDGRYYLIAKRSHDSDIRMIIENESRSYIVMAVGPNGFGVPTRGTNL
jgi:hypothetical protein